MSIEVVVESLQADLANVEETPVKDPYILAAKSCDRFVNIHPFWEGKRKSSEFPP
jgi:hypothetical protein